MTSKQTKLTLSVVTSLPLFLLLLAVYPVLYLLVKNQSQITAEDAVRSLWIAVGASLLISALCLLIFRPVRRAYICATLFNIAFFSYGHLFNLIDGKRIAGILVGRHAVFFTVFSVLVLAIFWVIMRRPVPRSNPAPILNAVLILLVLLQLIPWSIYQASARKPAVSQAAKKVKISSATPDAPDIYYIIIDGLAREDVLRAIDPGIDYSLPEELKKREFVIPDCAFTNYNGTSLSIASSLNFNYINSLNIPDTVANNGTDEHAELYNVLHENQVVAYLKQRGYLFVSFRGFFPGIDFREADYYYNLSQGQYHADMLAERSFQDMFLRSTLLRLPQEYFLGNPQALNSFPQFIFELVAPEASEFSSRSYQWYQQHLFIFNQLETLPSVPGRKFTYAHLYATHQPYVFRPDGSLLWPLNEDNAGYVSAVEYTSRRIVQVIDRILRDSPVPPVIIIQSDHGHGNGLDKFKIFNAYYLPNGGSQDIYATITPVNTFRVVLNRYAGGHFSLLPDNLMTYKERNQAFLPLPSSCAVK